MTETTRQPLYSGRPLCHQETITGGGVGGGLAGYFGLHKHGELYHDRNLKTSKGIQREGIDAQDEKWLNVRSGATSAGSDTKRKVRERNLGWNARC